MYEGKGREGIGVLRQVGCMRGKRGKIRQGKGRGGVEMRPVYKGKEREKTGGGLGRGGRLAV